MRCPFCHNWELVDGSAKAIMDEKELLKFLGGRKGLLDGVAFTGGEPTLREELPFLIREIKGMGFKVKLDTNGNNPDKLSAMLSEGLLDYVAMDVKNSRERYGETIGFTNFDTSRVEDSIKLLLSTSQTGAEAGDNATSKAGIPEGFSYEFRTTVVKQFHDEDSFKGIAELISGAENYYIQSFVDRETVHFSGFSACSSEELETFKKIVEPCVKHIEIRGV